jgi:hypothetical protein
MLNRRAVTKRILRINNIVETISKRKPITSVSIGTVVIRTIVGSDEGARHHKCQSDLEKEETKPVSD